MKTKEKKSQARKKSTVPTKVYTYGARPTSEASTQVLQDQVFAAHRYQQVLTQLEIDRRETFRVLRRTLDPKLNEQESEVDALETQIKDLRKGLKTKADRQNPDQVAILDQIKSLKTAKKAIYPQIQERIKQVMVVHFKAADEHYKTEKEARLKAAAKSKGVAQLGPRDPLHHSTVEDLGQEMLEGTWPKAWKIKFQHDRNTDLAKKKARGETSCNPGTYLIIEKACDQAKRDAVTDPQRKRFDRTGVVAIQLTKDKGLTVAKALAGMDSRLKIEMRPDIKIRKNGFTHRGTDRERFRQAATITLKLEGHKTNAVYVEMSAVFHRPLPEDGIIKWVSVRVDRTGYQPQYEVQFTIESNTFNRQAAGVGSGRVLAVNFGWRVLGDKRVRVATTWDGFQSQEVSLSADQDDRQKHYRDILGYSDDHFDTAIENVATWLKQENFREELFLKVRQALPRHLQESTDTPQKAATLVSRWRSHDKLRRVARVLKETLLEATYVRSLWQQWRDERLGVRRDLFCDGSSKPEIKLSFVNLRAWFEGKGITDPAVVMALYLEWWVRKDTHLVNWARNVERNLRLSRRETYRKQAAAWAIDYEHVIIEKWDKRKTAEVPESENDNLSKQEENANSKRQSVGISVFTQAVGQCFGPRLIEAPAQGITTNHFGCGGSGSVREVSTQIACDHCHRTYDQDLNAAKHLYARGCERLGGTPNPGGSRAEEFAAAE